MKIQFNLTEQEAVAFKNFYQAINTNGVTEEDFTKSAFMIGLQQMERIIIEKTLEAQKKAEEEAATEEPEIVEDETEETEEWKPPEQSGQASSPE